MALRLKSKVHCHRCKADVARADIQDPDGETPRCPACGTLLWELMVERQRRLYPHGFCDEQIKEPDKQSKKDPG